MAQRNLFRHLYTEELGIIGLPSWRRAGNRVALHSGVGTAWTVVREDSAEIRPAPLHRFVRVHPVADLTALIGALSPLSPHLAAVSIDGFGRQTDDAARALADLGA